VVLAIAIGVIVVLQPWGGLAAMLLAIVLALWWSTGATGDVYALLRKDAVSLTEKVYPKGWAGHDSIASYSADLANAPAAPLSATEEAAAKKAAADYQRLKSSMLPAALIMGLLIVVALGRYVAQGSAGPRQRILTAFRQLGNALRRLVLRQG
jgi:disulfide bond formation protein DsbB